MTIAASYIVGVNPSVLAAGGSNFLLNGLMASATPRIPIGTVLSFPTAAAVATYFGPGSTEATLATNYFLGYQGGTKTPAALLMAQFPYTGAVSAFLRGGSFGSTTFNNSGVTALTGVGFNIVIDGATFAVSALNLSSATSYSTAATAIQAALVSASPTLASVTGSISTTVLTVTAVGSGVLAVGQLISGAGVTAGTTITALGTGIGGTGTYTVSVSQTASSTTITAKPQAPTVTFDTVSASFVINSGSTGTLSTIAFPTNPAGGAFTGLLINAPQGAVISQGAPIATTSGTISAYLSVLAAASNAWSGLMTVFEPATADKISFASWVNANQGYWYAMWDTITASAYTSTTDTTSAGYQINAAGYNGTLPIGYDPNYSTTAALQATAAAALGIAASINWTQTNGRITLAFRSQPGLAATVASTTIASAMNSNLYTWYGAISNQGNVLGPFFYNGALTGAWKWWDSWLNQIWLNNNIQTSLIQLMQAIGNIPYSALGYGYIKGALYSGAPPANGYQPQSGQPQGPLAQALNFGAIRAGVILSANQIQAVNAAAGLNIDGFLNQTGFYYQVLDPGATVRAARGTPIINIWYMDGQSVQKMTVASVDLL